MATLRIVDLVKRYGDLVVVDHLNLEVQEGEFLTLLGPSGCGKTTILRAIAGLVEIDGGEIYFGDRLMNRVPPNQRPTAMVFQSYALFPHLTVRDNIAFGLRMRKTPRAELVQRVEEVMAMVGLAGLGSRRPHQLSGGQQQRVALARAVVTRPEMLLFDEPLSNLDAKLRERLRVEIRELQRRLRITSIYVTHDQAEALAISDRIAVLNEGRIHQLADPVSIYHRPANDFTADFIGQANILPARVVARLADGYVLETAIGRLVSSQPPGEDFADEILVSWRPEDMQVGDGAPDNCLDTRIVHTVFMGNLTDVLAEVNGTRIKMQITGVPPWQPGERVTLKVPPERIRLLKQVSGHGAA
jgi:ABC-type Fe3+/spermidine/putrescine transport system ATPase subunit